MKTLNLNLIVTFLVLLTTRTVSQNDTLNKLNEKNKRHGFWICFLDQNLGKTDSLHAFYYGYELFDNGRNLTALGKRNMKVYSISAPSNMKKVQSPILLNGSFVLLNRNGSERSIEEYKNGYPYIFKAFKAYKAKKLNDFELQYFDFSKMYQDQKGSFYFEERSPNSKDTTKYWFRKIDGVWKSVKIN